MVGAVSRRTAFKNGEIFSMVSGPRMLSTPCSRRSTSSGSVAMARSDSRLDVDHGSSGNGQAIAVAQEPAQNSPMAIPFRVALAQYLSNCDPDVVVGEAKNEGADVVVFPEMYSNG